MSSFDANAYFQRKAGNPITDKQNSIQQGIGNKYAALDSRVKAIKEEYAQHQDSWAGKLGLDANSFTGEAVNLGASFVSGASRVAGQIAELPLDVMTASIESQLSEDDIQAYNRYSQGTGSEEDIARLHSRKRGQIPPIQLIQQASESRAMSRNVADTFDLKNIVSQTKRNELVGDLGSKFDASYGQAKEGWDKLGQEGNRLSGLGDLASGVGKLVYNAGEAAVANPAASAEYVAENIPQLGVGLFGKAGKVALAASNAGYGSELYQQGITNYQQANDGQLPPEALRQEMARSAAGASLMEQASDMVMLGAGKIGKAIKKESDDVVRTGFKQSLLNIGKASTTGVISEAPTEGVQTYLEGEATLKPATAKDVYIGASIGGISGGALTGGGRAIAEGAKATPEQAQKREQDRQVQADLKTAIDNNDTSAYANDPVKQAQVLMGNAQKADTSPETKQANLLKANELVSGLEEQHASLRQFLLNATEADAETLPQYKEMLVRNKELLAQADTTDTARVEQLQGNITKLDELITAGSATPKEIKRKELELQRLERQLEGSRTVKDQLNQLVQPKPDEVVADIELADSVPDAANTDAMASSKAAVDRVINLSMASPDSLTAEDADRLASNTSNGLNEQQRNYLRSFSEARVAENSLLNGDDVSKRIYTGEGRDVGIAKYNQRMQVALATGRQNDASQLVKDIAAFATNHADKAATAELASKTSTLPQAQIVYNKTSKKWEVATKTYSNTEMKKNGGFTLSNPAKAIEMFKAEADAISKSATALKAMYELKFNAASPVNTVNSTQTPSAVVNSKSTDTSERQLQSTGVDSTVDSVEQSTKSSNAPDTNGVKANEPSNKVPATTSSEVVVQADNVSVQTNVPKNKQAHEKLTKLLSTEVISEISQEQETKVQAALELVPMLTGLMGNIEHVSTTVGETLASGAVAVAMPFDTASGKWAVVLSQKLLGLDVIRIARTLAHEVGHTLEDSIDLDQFKRSGNVAKEARAVTHEHMRTVLGYPTRKSDKWLAENQTSYEPELHAQVFSLYVAQPALLKEQMPITYALLESQYGSSTKAKEAAQNDRGSTNGNRQVVGRDGSANAGTTTEAGTETSPTDSREEVVDRELEALVSSTESGFNQPTEETAPNAGVLSLFSGFNKDLVGKPLGEVFSKVNLAAQFMLQKLTSDRYMSNRPLVAMKDFLAAWKQNPDLQEKFLGIKKGEKLSDDELFALDNLRKNMNKWVGEFKGQFKEYTGNKDYKQQDMLQYFLEGKGDAVDAEANFKAAMSYGVYNWILNKANSPTVLTVEQVNKMHGKDKEGLIDPVGYAELQKLSSFENLAANELGEISLQVLGLQARNDAPLDLMPKLRTAMGQHMLTLMESKGFIKRVEKTVVEVSNLFVNGSVDEDATENIFADRADDATFKYIQFVTNKDSSLTPAVSSIREANTGSHGIVDKLFGVEKAPLMPSLKPRKFTQKYARGTTQAISEAQREAIQATMDTPHKVIPEMYALFDALGKDIVLAIAGKKELLTDKYHDVNLPSIDAQNKNLENQFDLAMELVNTPDGLDAEFYVEQGVWKNYRAGFENAGLSQQTSKIHRVMFSRPNWTAKIDLSNDELVQEFKIAVAMNLGLVKTDQQRNITSIDKMNEKLESPDSEVLRAIEVIRDGLENDNQEVWTTENKQLVKEVAAKEGMLGLQAMVAYAKYLNAVKNNKSSFEVTMLVGADGKTNGPILSHLALGAADSVDGLYVLINRGGMYSTDEGQATHFSEWYEKDDSLDLYEDYSKKMLTEVKGNVRTLPEIKAIHASNKTKSPRDKNYKVFDYFTKPEFDAIQVVTKDLFEGLDKISKYGRDLVKTPMTAFAFGSAIKKSILSMENKFIESYYGALEDLAQGKRFDTREFLKNINVLINKGEYSVTNGQGKIPRLDLTTDIQELLRSKLTKEQEAAIRDAFSNIIGKSVNTSMNTYFKVFIERRKMLNNTIQVSFQAYDVAYADLREKEVNRLMELGLMDSKKVTLRTGKTVLEPRHDLTQEQEDAFAEKVKGLLPVMHTDYSLKEDNLDAGIFMAKSRSVSAGSSLYESKVGFKDAVETKQGKKVYHRIGKGVVRAKYAPGVAGTAYAMHSSDSAGMHKALLKVRQAQGLNVHDEISTGVQHIASAAMAINEATVDTFLNYSPAREALKMFERIAINLAGQVKRGEISKQTVSKIFDQWADTYNKKFFEPADFILPEEAGNYLLGESISNANAADHMRLGAIAKMAYMDQYTWEGGQFKVTETIRKQAAAQWKKLFNKKYTRLDDAIKYLTSVVADKEYEYTPTPHWVEGTIEEENEFDTEPEVTKPVVSNEQRDKAMALVAAAGNTVESITNTSWGKLREEGATSLDKPYLVAAFKEKELLTAKEVVAILKEKGQLSTFDRVLLDKLEGQLNPDATFRYVTANTASSDIVSAPALSSKGWNHTVVFKDGSLFQETYILSPEFVHSGLTEELLLHELSHAVLSRVIDQAEQTFKADKHSKDPAVAQYKELEALRRQVWSYIQKTGKGAWKYKEAGKSVQELVAWGMTNPSFRKDILEKMDMGTRSTRNPFSTAWESFLSTISNLLLGNSRKATRDGIEVLITNVTGLMEQAANSKPDNEVTINQSMASGVNSYTTEQLYDALDTGNNTDPAFDAHLRSLLKGIVTNIFDAYGSFKEARMTTNTGSAFDVWSDAIADGVAPFGFSAQSSAFKLNDQNAFVIEQVQATMMAALEDNVTATFPARRELERLYKEVYAHLDKSGKEFHDGDWAIATQQEKDTAKAKFDFLFDVNAGDHLARFAAMGLAHPEVNKLLQFNTSKAAGKQLNQTFAERLHAIFEQVLEWFNGKLTHTTAGQQADSKLTALVEQLVKIEAKRKIRINKQANAKDLMAPAEEQARKLVEAGRKKVADLAGSNWVRTNSSGFVRGGGALARTVANDQVEQLLNAMAVYRNKHWKQSLGITAGILNNVRGPAKAFAELLRGSKDNERHRKFIITQTRNAVLSGFEKGGKLLTDKVKEAVSAVLLRTGSHVLLNDFSMQELHGITSNKATRLQAIATYEAKLDSMGNFKADMLYQSAALGYYKATGKWKSQFGLMNANNIARMFGSAGAASITEAQVAQATPIIDVLVSLYALNYTSPVQLQRVSKLLESENQRTDGNGVEYSLLIHAALEKQSQERLFAGDPTLMMKGHTPEIYNPHTDIKVADEREGKRLENMGYTRGAEVERDAMDPSKTKKHIYVLRDGGMVDHLTTIMSLTGQAAKGSTTHNGNLDVLDPMGARNTVIQGKLTAAKQATLQQAIAAGPFDPSKVAANYTAPVLNTDGKAVNWRYLMQENTKDVLLERDNRPEHILGALAGSVYDKESTNDQNRKAIEALKELHTAEYALRADAFVMVGPNGSAENQEIYRLLPDVTKKAIKEIWGSDQMLVPVELMDLVFGYRKLSLSTMFNKVATNRANKEQDPSVDEFEGINRVQHAFIFGVEYALKSYAKVKLGMNAQQANAYAQRGAMVVRRAERGWQEVMKLVKDIIVVRTGTVFASNVFSNMTFLSLQGVSLADQVRHGRIAMQGAMAYQDDSEKLYKLQNQIETGYTQGKDAEIKREIKLLEKALENNPVKALIDAGLMPTIVEDLAAEDDPYSFKSAFTRKTDKYTSKINPTIKSIAKTVLITQDTDLYKALSKGTQLSDFVARYTLYQHLTNRKTKPMSAEDAVHEASEAFVNYDVPMHRMMQYTDDMGITMFTKYFLSIQRVLLKVSRENPLRVLMMLTLNHFYSGLDVVTDGSMVAHIGNNPFRSGVFQLPGTLDDIATIQGTMSLIK